MKTYLCEKDTDPSAVALGTFDGVHAGHRAVIDRAVELAGKENLKSVVYTFRNHPSSVWGKGQPLLNDPQEKEERIRRAGCDILVMRPFDAAFAALPAETFVALLAKYFRVRHLVVGSNYSFGRDRQGDPELLRALAGRYGYALHVCPLVEKDGEAVSSTRIRSCLEEGRIGEANRLLGYRYTLSGSIVHGKAIGRRMGFPTINVGVPEEKLLPRFGVYAAYADLEGKVYPCVLNVGVRPTVSGERPSVEAFLLQFSGEIYGKKAALHLEEFLRPETRFPDLDALRAQIGKDVGNAEKLLKARKIPVF